MKNFKQYLSESTKEHKVTIRLAAELDEGTVDRIERFLGKYDLRTISRVSTTPITKNSMFFEEDVTNTRISKIDVVTGYPVSADILRQQLADLLEMNIRTIAVHPEGWEPMAEPEETGEKKALLDSEYEDESDNGKHYGRTFVDNFLKSLSKRDEVTVENELSVKPKRDASGDQMSIEEGSSDSVISGDEE